MEKRLRDNINTVYLMYFCQSAMIVTAVFVPLLQRHGLSMTQVLQTQALFALIVAIAEVPSGYLADLWGRKKTIIIGQVLVTASFVWLVFADSFVDFLIYEGVIGLGISLGSGADLALLYDSQTALNHYTRTPAANHGNHISRLVALEGYAGAIAAIMASLLSLWSLDWILWAQCTINTFALVFALRLFELPRNNSDRSHRDNFHKVLRLVISEKIVFGTSLAIIVFGVIGLYAFWLLQKYWQLQGVPVTYFGYLWALHSIVRGVSAHFSHTIEKYIGWKNVFVVSFLLTIGGFIGMGFSAGVVGIVFGLSFPLSRGLNMVVFYDALNKRLQGEFRATVNSLVSLGTRGVFIVTGPLLGLLLDNKGVEYSLIFLAVVLSPIVLAVLLFLMTCIERGKSKSE